MIMACIQEGERVDMKGLNKCQNGRFPQGHYILRSAIQPSKFSFVYGYTLLSWQPATEKYIWVGGHGLGVNSTFLVTCTMRGRSSYILAFGQTCMVGYGVGIRGSCIYEWY
jgi:hypothetical protein